MKKSKIKPKHITNIEYQDFDDIYYYITYPGVKKFLYGINLCGDVISLVKNREKRRKTDFDRQGYVRIDLRTDDGKHKKIMLSRLVCWEFVGHQENYDELEVNHADGDKWNNYYKNLEWTTNDENSVHKAVYKLAASSDNHGFSTHREKVVRKVIKLMSKGLSAPEIAVIILQKYPQYYDETKYNYDRIRGLVSKIKRGVSWYNTKNEMEGSTTIENIIYEKHIGEEVSRLGLHPIPVRNSGRLILGNKE